MKNKEEILEFVAAMKNCKTSSIKSGFVEYVLKTDDLAGEAGGSIASRQIIALAISTWEMINKESVCV